MAQLVKCQTPVQEVTGSYSVDTLTSSLGSGSTQNNVPLGLTQTKQKIVLSALRSIRVRKEFNGLSTLGVGMRLCIEQPLARKELHVYGRSELTCLGKQAEPTK